MVTSLADPTANVIFGAVIDDAYEGEVHVTIIATGFSATFEDNILSGKVVRFPRTHRPLKAWRVGSAGDSSSKQARLLPVGKAQLQHVGRCSTLQ